MESTIFTGRPTSFPGGVQSCLLSPPSGYFEKDRGPNSSIIVAILLKSCTFEPLWLNLPLKNKLKRIPYAA